MHFKGVSFFFFDVLTFLSRNIFPAHVKNKILVSFNSKYSLLSFKTSLFLAHSFLLKKLDVYEESLKFSHSHTVWFSFNETKKLSESSPDYRV